MEVPIIREASVGIRTQPPFRRNGDEMTSSFRNKAVPRGVAERIRARWRAASAVGNGTLGIMVVDKLDGEIVEVCREGGQQPVSFRAPIEIPRDYPRDKFDGISRWIKAMFRGFHEKEFTLLGCGRLTPRTLRYDMFSEVTKGAFSLPSCGIYFNHISVRLKARGLGLYHLIQSVAIAHSFSRGADTIAATLAPERRWHERWRDFGYSVEEYPVLSEWAPGLEMDLFPAVLKMKGRQTGEILHHACETISVIGELLRCREVHLEMSLDLSVQCALARSVPRTADSGKIPPRFFKIGQDIEEFSISDGRTAAMAELSVMDVG
jgi:hypothetical protein